MKVLVPVRALLLALLIIGVTLSGLALRDLFLDSRARAIRSVDFPGGKVAVEVAVTPLERQQGLAGRPSLAPGRGMLFVFRETVPRRFTTEQMLFGLDIISLDAAGVVTGVATRMPGQPPFETAPARYILEVPSGWAEAHGVVVGTRAALRRSEGGP